MKRFLVFGFVCLVCLGMMACISAQAVRLDSGVKYPPTKWQDVKIYLTEKDVPQEFIRIAIVKAEGKEGLTSEEKMLEKLRQKAAEIGADAIIMESMKDPSDVERMADSLSGGMGLGSRKGRATAIKFK